MLSNVNLVKQKANTEYIIKNKIKNTNEKWTQRGEKDTSKEINGKSEKNPKIPSKNTPRKYRILNSIQKGSSKT